MFLWRISYSIWQSLYGNDSRAACSANKFKPDFESIFVMLVTASKGISENSRLSGGGGFWSEEPSILDIKVLQKSLFQKIPAYYKLIRSRPGISSIDSRRRCLFDSCGVVQLDLSSLGVRMSEIKLAAPWSFTLITVIKWFGEMQ